MNKNVLLDSIARTARDLAKYAKYYDKYMSRSVGPNDLNKAEQYMQLYNIQRGLLRNLRNLNR